MSWYLLQTKPRQDARAEMHLLQQDYICFRPQWRVQHVKAGKIHEVSESLFPGYLFIFLQDNQNWSSVRSTRGVKGVVRFGEYALPVPEVIVESIKNRVLGVQVRGLFEKGERVMISDGPFSGLNAIFQSVNGDERVTLLVNLIHRVCLLDVPVGLVAKLA